MRFVILLAVLVLFHFDAHAESVTTSSRVERSLLVRAAPTKTAPVVGKLNAGEKAGLIERVPRWYKVRLPSGQEGFVSKSYTHVLADGPAALAAAPTIAPKQTDDLRVTYMNVGAGLCAVVECPGANARPIVVDCGTSDGSMDANGLSPDQVRDRMNAILARYSQGPDLVISHVHADHYNLIAAALRDVQVNEIWHSGVASEMKYGGFTAWFAEQKRNGARVRSGFPKNWHNGGNEITDGLQCGAATAYVLSVNANPDGNPNGSSLMLAIDYLDFTLVLPGDAEGPTEASAMGNFQDLKTTVLTSSHHGSKSHNSNSALWIEATSPELVIYSAGEMHGHPTCATTDKISPKLASATAHNAVCAKSKRKSDRKFYSSKRAEFTTLVNGTITLTTPGTDRIRVQCELGPGCDQQVPF